LNKVVEELTNENNMILKDKEQIQNELISNKKISI